MKIGDLATWIGAIATSGALIFAFIQLTLERRSSSEKQTRLQATNISAWIVKPYDFPMEICLLNTSSEPIYEVVITVVSIQGAAIRDAHDAPRDYPFRNYLSVLPPGRYSEYIQSDGHGMSLRFALEIGFTDSFGYHWVRKGSGRLNRNNESAPDYYELSRPIRWEYPSEEKVARI